MIETWSPLYEGIRMKVCYRESKDIRDTVFDYSESQFSPDEIIKQIVQRLRDNQLISFFYIENFDLYEKGAYALSQAILEHQSLRYLSFNNMRLCSYPVRTNDEYFFPEDLDLAVKHLCEIIRKGNLWSIQIINLDFYDRTEHHYEHVDMVEPTVMRDILLQEKQPYYFKEILDSFNHNPNLLHINFSTVDVDMTHAVKEIEENIKKRHNAE